MQKSGKRFLVADYNEEGATMTLAETIYDYAAKVASSPIDGKTSEEIKKRIVDSIFVSYGARNAEPLKIAMKSLLPSRGKLNAPIYFTNRKAAIDVSSFINGSMTRYLDYNDTYLSKEALHPSDNIPPILAYAYANESSGESILKSIAVAYQVVGALSDAVSIRDRGWDHVTYISISVAAGLATLNGYERDRFVHTLNLAINNNISLRQTRAGELSMWKGCTAANASRNSVFASMLAGNGFSGPSPIFEGEMGFFRQVSGEFTLDFSRNLILKTMIKNFPVEYHAMSAVESALNLRKQIGEEQIKEINVDTFSVAHKIIVKDPEKLRPKTKETADHSMPYIIAYTLLHGEPDLSSFGDQYLKDSNIHRLIDIMNVKVKQEYDKMYPEYLPVKITVITSGGRYESEVLFPKGHFKNPYSWEDLLNKGERILGSREKANEILEAGRKIERITVREFFEVINQTS